METSSGKATHCFVVSSSRVELMRIFDDGGSRSETQGKGQLLSQALAHWPLREFFISTHLKCHLILQHITRVYFTFAATAFQIVIGHFLNVLKYSAQGKCGDNL